MPKIRRAFLLAAVGLAGASLAGAPLSAQKPPKSGLEVLQRMHDAYAGKWFQTLAFSQQTTRYDSAGTPHVSSWYERLRQDASRGTQLRIDIGDPADGNLYLFTADSTWVVRGGKLVRAVDHGNEFLPLIEGVYVQPVSRTARELRAMGFDLDRVAAASWEGRPAWVIGVSAPGDSSAPQFWVDRQRNIVVHALFPASPGRPALDVRLDGYVRLAGGWLATRIIMSADGKPLQTEKYSEWKAGVDLPAKLFDPGQWPPEKP